MKRLSLKAGLSESAVRDYLHRGKDPTIETFSKIAKALGMPPAELLQGEDPTRFSLPVIGMVSGGETWAPIQGVTMDVAGEELRDPDNVVLEVRGDWLSPAYRDGDFLVCQRRGGRYAENLIGLDCAILTTKGERYLKILKKGRKQGLFNLKSFRPMVDDVEDVAIEWAAPVGWIKRRGR